MKTTLFKKTAIALCAGCFLSMASPVLAADAVVENYTVPGSSNPDAFAKSKPAQTSGVSVKEKKAQKAAASEIKVANDTPSVKVTAKTETASMDALKAKVKDDQSQKVTVIQQASLPENLKKVMYGEDVQDWTASPGDTVQSLLMKWSEDSGWTLVWKMDRDYVLEAGVVFRGTYMDVSMALLRSFARAVPAPIGTFFKGNRVLVVSTREDENEG